MSIQSRRELLKRIKTRYLKASKKEKSLILDEFIKNSGMERKYVITLFFLKKISQLKI